MPTSLSPLELPAWRCDQVRSRLAEFLDGELPADLDTVVREHLAICPPCVREVTRERRFRAALARAAHPEPAPESLRERLRRTLDAADRDWERTS